MMGGKREKELEEGRRKRYREEGRDEEKERNVKGGWQGV